NMLGLAHIYFLKQDYPAATDLLTQYNDLFEPTAESELILGKIYLQQGKIKAAQTAIENVLANDPSHIEAKFLLSMIFLSDEKEDGEKLLKEVVASPNASQAMLDFNTTWQEALQTKNEQYRKSLLAFGLLEAEQPYLALAVIEPVIEAVPQYRDAHYLLAVAYYQTDQFSEAALAVDNALKIDKDHAASKELKTAITKALGEDTITPEPTISEENN
ncbi:tetratricopeptide repeat protein, partial [candidate division WWE3 bacterium]|nr:tetratricopeptide repeat protein [candidate division WWE3 bacterium]